MKKVVKCEEVTGEGLMALLGEKVILFCMNYIYAGTLQGVNDTCVLLGEDAAIVYETGPFDAAAYKDSQCIGTQLYVQIAAIEAFGPGK
jgi:hypothetical protein